MNKNKNPSVFFMNLPVFQYMNQFTKSSLFRLIGLDSVVSSEATPVKESEFKLGAVAGCKLGVVAGCGVG